MKKRITKIMLAAVCTVLTVGFFSVAAFAADEGTTDNGEKKDEIDYTLDREVKEWLDGGGSIPSEAKYCTLGSSSHMWSMDDTDISDGKVVLTGIDETETRTLAGIALRDWLKTQSFYGEKLGEKDNKIKFKRPGKSTAF